MAEEKKEEQNNEEVKEEKKEETPEEKSSEKKEEAKEEKEEKPKKEKEEEPVKEKEEKEVEVPAKFKDIVEKIEKMTVVDLADLVSLLEKKFKVSAVAPAAAGGGAAGGGEEKAEVNVVLKDAGSQKINVIKAVKEITGLGLQEAKGLVDGAPGAIKGNVKREEAEEMKSKLEEAGATVELE